MYYKCIWTIRLNKLEKVSSSITRWHLRRHSTSAIICCDHAVSIILNFSYALTGGNLVTIAKFNLDSRALFLYTPTGPPQSRSRKCGKRRYKDLGRKSEEEKEVLTFWARHQILSKKREKNYALPCEIDIPISNRI